MELIINIGFVTCLLLLIIAWLKPKEERVLLWIGLGMSAGFVIGLRDALMSSL